MCNAGTHDLVQYLRYAHAVQVDSALLSHPNVAEAVSFAAPNEKYGEAVAAAIVPAKEVGDVQSFIADVKNHAGSRLAKFKVGTGSSHLHACADHPRMLLYGGRCDAMVGLAFQLLHPCRYLLSSKLTPD